MKILTIEGLRQLWSNILGRFRTIHTELAMHLPRTFAAEVTTAGVFSGALADNFEDVRPGDVIRLTRAGVVYNLTVTEAYDLIQVLVGKHKVCAEGYVNGLGRGRFTFAYHMKNVASDYVPTMTFEEVPAMDDVTPDGTLSGAAAEWIQKVRPGSTVMFQGTTYTYLGCQVMLSGSTPSLIALIATPGGTVRPIAVKGTMSQSATPFPGTGTTSFSISS